MTETEKRQEIAKNDTMNLNEWKRLATLAHEKGQLKRGCLLSISLRDALADACHYADKLRAENSALERRASKAQYQLDQLRMQAASDNPSQHLSWSEPTKATKVESIIDLVNGLETPQEKFEAMRDSAMERIVTAQGLVEMTGHQLMLAGLGFAMNERALTIQLRMAKLLSDFSAVKNGG